MINRIELYLELEKLRADARDRRITAEKEEDYILDKLDEVWQEMTNDEKLIADPYWQGGDPTDNI